MKEHQLTFGEEFYLYTDGSGHPDGIGGYCAVLCDKDHNVLKTAFGGSTETSVYREEFKGLLAGLELLMRYNKRVGLDVNWFGDNESLVKGVQKEYKNRENHSDLWCLLEYFEGRYSINANHVKRTNKIPMMMDADMHASTCRVLIKEYLRGIE